MIARTETLTASEVRDASALLLEHHLHAGGLQGCDQKIVAEQCIGEHHIAGAEYLAETAQQPQLAVARALIRADRRLQHRTARQTDHRQDARQRKAHASGLTARLGIARLVGCGVRHRDRAAVHQLHGAATPTPALRRPLAQQPPRLARERHHHLNGQPLSCTAIRCGVNAVCTQSFRHTLRGPAVDRLLARAILVQRLLHEHRQSHRRRIQPLAVFGQVQLGLLQQFRARQHVEETHRLDLSSSTANALAVLL
jgi:hypothetical protein